MSKTDKDLKTLTVAIIDCAVKILELEAFNRLVLNYSPLYRFNYHVPAICSLNSLKETSPDIVIIFGSLSNVEDQLSWQQELAHWCIQKLKQNIPILGICFGHQLIAHEFGATIARHQYNLKKQKPYQGFRQWIPSCDFFSFKKNHSYGFLMDHCFEIAQLPDCFTVLATGEDSPFEVIKHMTLPFVSTQSHPEAGPDFVPALDKENRDALTQEQILMGLEHGQLFIKGFLEWARQHLSEHPVKRI